MNTYRYDEEKRKQWVRDKLTRAKNVKQICREASVSRATLYNWLDEFKYLCTEINDNKTGEALSTGRKTSRPELLQKTSPETGERYRMLVSAIAGADTNKTFSKKLVAMLVKRFTLTVPQACAVVGIDENIYGYKPRKPEVEDYIVYEALVKLIHEDRTRNFETCYELLLKQNPEWTRKQIKRVYRDGMVYLERQRSNTRWEKAGKAKTPKQEGKQHAQPSTSNKLYKTGSTWNLGLLEYTSVFNNRQQDWWLLCIIDDDTNVVLNAMAALGQLSAESILSFLDKAAAENGLPRKLKIPGKQALTVRELTRWVWQHKMALHTFSLNKPENIVAIEQLENDILNRLDVLHITSPEQLMNATEKLIATSHSA